jgi:hypothetical protein
MKRTVLFGVFVVLAIAVPATAAPITYTGVLTGTNEEPPNASPATGTTSVTVDPVAHTLRVVLDFSGLLAPSTAAHIHVINGPGDLNLADTVGPVATTTPAFVGFPVGVTSGSMDQTYDTTFASTFRAGFITDAGGLAQAEAVLFAALAEGRAYLNVHSSLYPGGEIRDFLAPAAVPEPAGATLLGAAGIAWLLRRRRGRA